MNFGKQKKQKAGNKSNTLNYFHCGDFTISDTGLRIPSVAWQLPCIMEWLNGAFENAIFELY